MGLRGFAEELTIWYRTEDMDPSEVPFSDPCSKPGHYTSDFSHLSGLHVKALSTADLAVDRQMKVKMKKMKKRWTYKAWVVVSGSRIFHVSQSHALDTGQEAAFADQPVRF